MIGVKYFVYSIVYQLVSSVKSVKILKGHCSSYQQIGELYNKKANLQLCLKQQIGFKIYKSKTVPKSQSLKIQQLNQTMQQLSYLSPQQDQPQQTPEQNFPSQSFYPYKNQSTTNSSQYHQKKQQSDSNYTTSINQLIAQPIEENYYSMEYVYQSIYQLSDYLWNKKIKAHYLKDNQQNISRNAYNSMSFDDYLLPLQEELNKYDKFKKSKNKQEQEIYTILAAQSKHNNLTSLNSPNNNPNTLAPTPNSLNSKNKISPFKPQPLINIPSLQSQLNKCYQQVPFIYFQQSFSLDFSNFQDKQNRLKYNNTQKMKEQQEDMNDNLDLIQINLFGQIHRKFEDYFRAAANFDYLKESISLQLIKLKQARSRVSRVQIQFIIKSQKLRKKIIQRNNYQKLLKKMKILKSLKKLPSIIQTILQSSLPYQCLQLLKTTKKSISQVQQIKCVQSILTNIKTSETIVQLGLNKRYTDELYLYIEETFRVINFQELFKKAALDCPVTDKDNMNNSSTLNNISRRSQNLADANGDTSFRAGDRSGFFVLEQLGEGKGTSTFNGKLLLKNFYAKRQQGKQYQIAMILLQSYEYVDFPVDVTKIKISNGLRVICRKFQKDLISHIKKQLQKSALIQQKSILNDSIDQQNPKIKISSVNNAKSPLQKDQDDSAQKISQYINKVSIQFYIKHIRVLNELFKQSINRYLGYVLTLVTQYEEKLYKQILQIEKVSINKKSSTKSIEQLSEKSIAISDSESHLEQLTLSKVKSLQKSQKMSKMQTSHNKFKQILSEELSVLPSIFKIIEQKIKHFLTMKNISNSTPHQFFQWISLVRFWQRWFDVLIQESVLINYNCTYLHSNTEISSSTQLLTLGQDMIQELINVVLDNVKKSMGTMNLKNLITDLTINYLNAYASNINSQLYQTVLDQSWQSVQIPQQFSEVLNGIISRPNQNQNMSITILDASTNKLSSSFASSNNKSSLQPQQSINSTASQFKYKILKNNILIEGQRYKLTISFLLLSQFIEELIRVGRLFQGITGQNDEESLRQSKYIRKILAHLYDKIYELIDYYNAATKEMILEKKALKMEKIKGNNITVKHICLLSNCLTFLQKITKQIPLKDLNIIINKKQRQAQTIYSLTNHNILLIDKISSILHKKMQQTVSNVKSKQQQKNFNTTAFYQFVCQSNQSIVTLFLQITQIIDEYLDVQKCQKILKLPFQLFVQKYFKMVILKGDKFLQEASILLEKMKFLKKYFKNQFISMQREIQQ